MVLFFIMIKYLLIAMRPRQWSKNLIIFAALLFAQEMDNLNSVLKVCIAFGLFSLISGCGYLINDIIDVENDKLHPKKQTRPIASGKLGILPSLITAICLILLILLYSFRLQIEFGIVITCYFLLTTSYSIFLKRIVILDVLTISLGFVFRVVAGAVIIEAEISPWLVICTMLLALFLGLCKRRHELVIMEDAASSHRVILKEYTPAFIDEMVSAITGATIIAYSFYAFDPSVQAKLSAPYLPLTVPFVLYGIFRYLYLVHQKGCGGNPEMDIFSDKPMIINICFWILTTLVIIYG